MKAMEDVSSSRFSFIVTAREIKLPANASLSKEKSADQSLPIYHGQTKKTPTEASA